MHSIVYARCSEKLASRWKGSPEMVNEMVAVGRIRRKARGRHVEALVREFHSQELSIRTMRNRMARPALVALVGEADR